MLAVVESAETKRWNGEDAPAAFITAIRPGKKRPQRCTVKFDGAQFVAGTRPERRMRAKPEREGSFGSVHDFSARKATLHVQTSIAIFFYSRMSY